MDTRAPGTYVVDASSGEVSGKPGVAWSAIAGGAVAAAGVALSLVPLGGAMGYAASPWHYDGGKTFTIMAAVWLIIVQWLSSGFGGYITGRLRTKWVAVHTHEVFFRDTMHGFLSWALASLIGVLLVTAMASHAMGEPKPPADSYVTNMLFRSPIVTATSPTSAPAVNVSEQDRHEADHVVGMGVVNGQIPDSDRDYLAQLVVNRTGVSNVEAQTRIDNAVMEGKRVADNAAKASFFICLSLMIGAFIAAAAGALGGIHRDIHSEHGTLKIVQA